MYYREKKSYLTYGFRLVSSSLCVCVDIENRLFSDQKSWRSPLRHKKGLCSSYNVYFLNFAAGAQWFMDIVKTLMSTSKVSLVWQKAQQKFLWRNIWTLAVHFREFMQFYYLSCVFLYREAGFFKSLKKIFSFSDIPKV